VLPLALMGGVSVIGEDLVRRVLEELS
jgi:hypothetical protein